MAEDGKDESGALSPAFALCERCPIVSVTRMTLAVRCPNGLRLAGTTLIQGHALVMVVMVMMMVVTVASQRDLAAIRPECGQEACEHKHQAGEEMTTVDHG